MARKSQKKNSAKQKGPFAFLRNPLVQVGILVVVAVIVISIAIFGSGANSGQASSISPTDAYKMVQSGAFLLDVRTQAEWDQYHVPGATLIPLDELPNRLNELPKNKQIVVICHFEPQRGISDPDQRFLASRARNDRYRISAELAGCTTKVEPK